MRRRGGTEISFCLATSKGEVPLALKQISRNDDDQRSVEFELESQNGDVVPNVVVGDSLEARHGGNNGQADWLIEGITAHGVRFEAAYDHPALDRDTARIVSAWRVV